MSRTIVQNIVKGDIIVERVNGKNRMTPVRQVEFNACSSKGVHINRNSCYDFNAVVDLVEAESTLDDLEEYVEETIEADQVKDGKRWEKVSGPNPHLKHVHIPNGMSAEELAEALVKQ